MSDKNITAKRPVRWWGLAWKAIVIFAVFNVLFYALEPMRWLNQITVYNTLVPGRERLPFSEAPQQAYSLSVFDLTQMLASHVIARPKAADEYRVAMIGDSSVWGYLLPPDQTEAACLNNQKMTLPDGRRVQIYNLGYPKLSVVKDVMIMQRVLDDKPDLILWPTTLASLYPTAQLSGFEIITHNRADIDGLMARFHFKLDEWPLPAPTWDQRTFFGQRANLALWLRYQLYGLGWGATGNDWALDKFPLPHPVNLNDDDSIFSPPPIQMHTAMARKLVAGDISLDVVQAGITLAGEKNVPVLLVNEPIAHPGGKLRWDYYYPRWAYDDYRQALQDTATQQGWHYVDFWDAEPDQYFTDTDFHLTAQGACDYAAKLSPSILQLAGK